MFELGENARGDFGIKIASNLHGHNDTLLFVVCFLSVRRLIRWSARGAWPLPQLAEDLLNKAERCRKEFGKQPRKFAAIDSHVRAPPSRHTVSQ
jgi:hypothetical protein